MSQIVGGDGRTHINSRLMRESLQNREVLSHTDSDRDIQIFPDVSLVSIGGQSIFDRGLPGGGMAQLVGAMEELNAILLNTLLAPHGSMPMQRDHFWDLPLYFDAGITPIAISVPPYHFWEPPP